MLIVSYSMRTSNIVRDTYIHCQIGKTIPKVVFVAIIQSLSHVQLFVTPMNCSTPAFPVLHHLPELAQTRVHSVGGAIQPSCPLSSPSPPAFNLAQHQGLF